MIFFNYLKHKRDFCKKVFKKIKAYFENLNIYERKK